MLGLDKEEKKVEYLELIYDLIFVYLIGRNNSLIHHIEGGFVQAGTYFTYIICTLIIIQIWSMTTFFINRHGTNGIAEHITIFINMYLLYYMADGTRVDWHEYFYRYNVAWGLILLNLAVQYFLKLRKSAKETPWEAVHIRRTMSIILIQALLVFVSIPVYTLTRIPFSPLAMVFGIVASIKSERFNQLMPVDFMHLTERAMLYIVFTFGEMIIAIASYFSGGFGFNTVYFSLMAFLIVVGLFLSYGYIYDHLLDREMSTDGSGYMLIHVFLIFALSNITTALEFMREAEVNHMAKTMYLIGSFLLYYVFLFLTVLYAKKRSKPTKRFLVTLVAMGVVFSVLMVALHRQMYINIAITVIFVFAILVTLYRCRRCVEDDV